MGKIFEQISPELKEWLYKQKIFFVATAPLSAEGHINCSPKGLDSFRVLGPNRVAYQDLTGSGVETIAHLRENKRIILMFTAFEGPPKIVRLHGQGTFITPEDAEFESINTLFTAHMSTRAYIVVDVTRISDSCGYSVPLYTFKADRDVGDKWCANKGPEGLITYRAEKNAQSIDGLKGL